MNIIEVFQSFQTQEQAIAYLEKVRWHGQPSCPYCGSIKVSRHVSGDRAMPRWQCLDCVRAFAVTVGTIFHGTHIPLRNWFLVIALMLNAKKSASACQIARDIGMRRPTVWSMMHRIRFAMNTDTRQSRLLHGIVEADETYIGGKPRKGRKRDAVAPNKRGRGTGKAPIVGVVERGGRVVAAPFNRQELSAKSLARFISRFVDKPASLLVTDEFGGYFGMGRSMHHVTVNHKVEYANGLAHTNTIEGFWALVKRAWYGQHHYYSRKYMPLYVSEACFKYNHRGADDTFARTIGIMVAA